MKKVLGLDLGSASIGWALIHEAQNSAETTQIIKLGVRIVPNDTKNVNEYKKGKNASANALRTEKRGIRRRNQRFKQRRDNLVHLFLRKKWISSFEELPETGKNSTHQILELRAKAATEKISLQDFCRVLLRLCQKRGYKSNRKVKQEEGQSVDAIQVAKELYNKGLTPGQYANQLLAQGNKNLPNFYRSDLQEEFRKIWDYQKQFHPELTQKAYAELQHQKEKETWSICHKLFGVQGITFNNKEKEFKKKIYALRANALKEKLDLEHLTAVFQHLNSQINRSDGYLQAISDRSKELYFSGQTIGQYLYQIAQENFHNPLKNKVFYRRDYIEEFERIWDTQAQFHPELTLRLRRKIRDEIIFYQRRLKSQKNLVGFCQLEPKKNIQLPDGKEITTQPRVAPKSSPLAQEAKIWQMINHIELTKINSLTPKGEGHKLTPEQKEWLFQELNIKGSLSDKDILKKLNLSSKVWKINYSAKELQGNATNKALYDIYKKIAENEGLVIDWDKKSALEIKKEIQRVFEQIGIDPRILNFDPTLPGKFFEQQPSYQLWLLLYSAEDDPKITQEDALRYGNTDVNLKKKLIEKFGFPLEYAQWLSRVTFPSDYGNLSAKALRKIIPFLQQGFHFAESCQKAGYHHSHTPAQRENQPQNGEKQMALLPKNSLRNPVVERVLNHMVNVVNQIIKEYGAPEIIRIELARDLKNSTAERQKITEKNSKKEKERKRIRELIIANFPHISNPTEKDIIRYQLWEKMAKHGHKQLYPTLKNGEIQYQYIPLQDLFSPKVDIDHIVPQSLVYDDSLSNKILCLRDTNLQKSNRTAYDFIQEDYGKQALEDYVKRIENLFKDGVISEIKRRNLLISQENLEDGFIRQDLVNTPYIARKVVQMLREICPEPPVMTNGKITAALRQQWGLLEVMKEMNLPKFRALGYTTLQERFDSGQGKSKMVEIITDWSKRNDYRHHALDALVVALTSQDIVNSFNFNSTLPEEKQKEIRKKYLPKNLRQQALKHLGQILISFKPKSRVATKNVNLSQTKKHGKITHHTQNTLTPRGSLHEETLIGTALVPESQPTKINNKLTLEQAQLIQHPVHKELVINHLARFENNPKEAFAPKNLKRFPLLYKDQPLTQTICYKRIFTKRKEVSKDLKVDRVIDPVVRKILKNRLQQYGGDPKKAFADLEKNPIWLNQEKGIKIKRVRVTGVTNAKALYLKKDHFGKILTREGKGIQSGFVTLGNNHHVAIYQDAQGELQELVMPFLEAIRRVSNGLPPIYKEYNKDLGWKFLFSMKINEMFVFPNEDFDLEKMDLTHPENNALISKHLYRVQKLSTKCYYFRHHLETTTDDIEALRGTTFKVIRSLKQSDLGRLKKVRIDHLGMIRQVGEE